MLLALAAQLLQAKTDCLEIIGGANAAHVPSITQNAA
jgi:hypothetical protein